MWMGSSHEVCDVTKGDADTVADDVLVPEVGWMCTKWRRMLSSEYYTHCSGSTMMRFFVAGTRVGLSVQAVHRKQE